MELLIHLGVIFAALCIFAFPFVIGGVSHEERDDN